MPVTQHDADLKRDKNNQVLHVARSIRTEDGNTGSPKASPLTVGGSILTLKTPLEAAELVILNTDGDLQFSEDSTMTRYCVLPATAGIVLGCTDGGDIYLRSDSGGNITVQFYYSAL